MNLGLLVVPALAGYWVLGRTCYTRYWFMRQSGYELALSSALSGLILFAVAHLLVIEGISRHEIAKDLMERATSWISLDHAQTLVATFVFALVIPLLVNAIARKSDVDLARAAARKNGDFIECLLADAKQDTRLVEVSTISSKSYIGMVVESGIFSPTRGDIALIPFASGYRKPKTRRLQITTYHVSALMGCRELGDDQQGDAENSSKLSVLDFQIIIPGREIASTRFYDFSIRGLFQDVKES